MRENDLSGSGNEGAAETSIDEEIDINLRQSFPASDPPSWTLGHDHDAKNPEEADSLDEG